MKQFFELLKSALVTGMLVVLPAWLALILLLKVFKQFGGLVKPISNQVPEQFIHPNFVAVILFVLVCILIGVLIQTTVGRIIGKTLSENVFSRIPGYQSFSKITRQFTDLDANHGFKPALIDVEDGCLAPAFLIEEHGDGNSTVFMPSVPTPMAGAIFIMPAGRVHPINIPVPTMIKCISQWGSGSAVLLAALEESKSVTKAPSPED